MVSPSIYLCFETCMTSDSKVIKVSYSSSAERLMVKTTSESDLPWSAIFSVIVYWLLDLLTVQRKMTMSMKESGVTYSDRAF